MNGLQKYVFMLLLLLLHILCFYLLPCLLDLHPLRKSTIQVIRMKLTDIHRCTMLHEVILFPLILGVFETKLTVQVTRMLGGCQI
jgi:hypothetical protein